VNLILLERAELGRDGAVTLTDARARHAIEVLKVTPGQALRIGVLDGPKGVGMVTAVADGRVGVACQLEASPPALPAVDLLLALPRPKVMRRLWAQLAAMGVGRIILTNASRVERNYFDTHVLTPDCYRPLLIEGLQQAQDTLVPRVTVHRRFKVLVEDELDSLSAASERLVAHPTPDAAALASRRPAPGARVLLAVGPEGGWDDYEMGLLESRGFQPVSIGTRTLRTDTACVALLATLRA
jgi:16S rRNA (uracil1498-N3)-methyltransferase